MTLVVTPTQPYTNQQLGLDNTKRWSKLIPLMRPSTKVIEIPGGHTVFLDTAHISSKNVLLVAVGTTGHFSSKILSDTPLVAFTIEQEKGSKVSSLALVEVLKTQGLSTQNGIFVIRSGSEQSSSLSSGVLELLVEGNLQFDHVLSLLSAAKPDIRASVDQVKLLLDSFIKSANKTSSTFHHEKTGDAPTVKHAVGAAELSSAKSAIEKDLDHVLGTEVPCRDVVYSIHYADINGLSRLETNIIAYEIYQYADKRKLSLNISHSTVSDHNSPARGWAISVAVIPDIFISAQSKPTSLLADKSSIAPTVNLHEGTSRIKFSDSQVRKIITKGCESVIKHEQTITEYDTIVGDGDCGYTLRDGATQVLQFIQNADLSVLPSMLSSLVDNLEVNMGGTSGALYCIFLSALAQSLRDAATFPEALKGALNQLLQYTKARLGDRTCLDCLIPFVDTLLGSGNVDAALEEAGKGVERTKDLRANLGRSSYLDESATKGVPDPGAYGLLKLLEGMVDVPR